MEEVIRAIQEHQVVGRHNVVQDTATIITTIMGKVKDQIRLNSKSSVVGEIVETINSMIVEMAQVLVEAQAIAPTVTRTGTMIDGMGVTIIWIHPGVTVGWTVWIV